MKKCCAKVCALLSAAAILLTSASLPVSAAFNHQPYWALQSAYNKAVSSGNNDALLDACEGIVKLYASFPDLDASLRVEGPALKAAKIYEERGEYDDALRMYEAYRESLAVRKKFSTEDVRERLIYADAFIESYAYMEPTVYVHAASPYNAPYFNEKAEPLKGTVVGMCDTGGKNYDEALNSGYIQYVQFEKETIRDFDHLLPDTDSYYLYQVAWNIPDNYSVYGAIEYFNKIAEGKFDSYIVEDLRYLGGLKNCGVLLRFAAEVNVWNVNSTYYWEKRLDQFKQSYIAAFRHVHNLAEKNAPNVAMVYSPNDISNLYVTHEDFYPGDAYVDWVGLSTYNNLSDEASYEYGNMPDAYYRRGVYENQMLKIKDIVDAYGDRKPIVISESGTMYRSSSSYQTEEHAKKSIETFYTYVNMLFPQVKAVFYFNTNHDGNEYCLFGFGKHSDNPYLASVYKDLIHENPVMEDTLAGKESSYTRLENLCEKRTDLTLTAYAAYPGNPEITVTYKLDGKTVCTAKEAPYTCQLSKERLTVGKHTLAVTTKAGAVSYTYKYTVEVMKNGIIRVGDAPLLGDISGDLSVDIADALHLFMYSMLPKEYPVLYKGNIDFERDGSVDIGDALKLFMYSMLPENYPIG